MKIISIVTGYVGTNTFIAFDDSERTDPSQSCDAIIVDAGDNYERICSKLTEYNLVARAVILTHGHFDHSNACKSFQDNGATIYIHKADADMLCTDKNLASLRNIPFNKLNADIELNGGEILEICGLNIRVLHTPGHTAGSVCYIVNDVIFSGDTLFYKDVGRTDLPSGDYNALINSLRSKLFTLEGDYQVLCGHDRFTTLAFEKVNNPYA